MCVFKMDAVVGGSNPACVAAAAACSLEWVAEIRNTGCVGAKYALKLLSIQCFLCLFIPLKSNFKA